MSDLEERERSAISLDPSPRAGEEEDMISRKLKEDIAQIRAMHTQKLQSIQHLQRDIHQQGREVVRM